MKLNNNEINGTFVMPKSVVKYLKTAKKAESKLIMYIFANIGESFDAEKAAAAISESPAVINSALAFWRGTGIISELEEDEDAKKTGANNVPTEKPLVANDSTLPENSGSGLHNSSDNPQTAVGENTQDTAKHHMPTYNTEDVADALKNDAEFKQLVNYTEHTIGQLLNSSKTASLLYLYDCLGMQCDVIMGIIAHCAEQGKTSIKYIERTAEGIHNDGVVTYKQLESYYAAKRRYTDYESAVKRIIGAPDRALTPREAKLVNTWANEYKTNKELVEYAYELTVNSISKPSLSYMGKIIEDWYKSDINSLESAKAARENNSKKASEKPTGASGGSDSFDNFSFEDIFERP